MDICQPSVGIFHNWQSARQLFSINNTPDIILLAVVNNHLASHHDIIEQAFASKC